MKKICTFLDCDGFIFNTIPAHIDYLEYRYGIRFTLSDFAAQPDLSKLLRDVLGEKDELSYNEVYRDLGVNFISNWEWHKDILPFEGAVESLKRLCEHAHIYIVTKRPDMSRGVLTRLVQLHMPHTISEMFFCYSYDKNKKWVYVPKKEIILRLTQTKFDMFFDDSLHECIESPDLIHTHLFDPKNIYGNNPIIKGGDMAVVRSWQSVEEKVMENIEKFQKSLVP